MPQKDFTTLIRAFAKVRQQRPCRLMILGEWSGHKAVLDALIQELQIEADVELPGFVYNPYPYMAQASVFALSSRYEGFGNVLVEAMAVGTPVVATNCESGPAEILEHGKYGPLVPVGDADALAEAIVQTLNHPVDPMILQARAEDFSSRRIAKQYLQCFQTVQRNEFQGG
jgi:glycosyltransferase involved in cell wall biosynthesis